ncbi:MAG: glycosyltransferase family 9 protein [Candidatus Paceibacterota bacterium]
MTGRVFTDNSKKEPFSVKMRAYFIGFCYDSVNSLLKLISNLLWPKKVPLSPKNICIYRIGNIGDIICSIPAFIAIRKAYPYSKITLLTSPGGYGRPGAKELLESATFMDKLWVYYADEVSSLKSAYNFSQRMRAESFDLLIYLPQQLIMLKYLFRNFIFLKLCGAKKTVGFELSTIKLWASEQSKIYQFDNEVDRLINLLKRCGIPVSGGINYDLPVPNDKKESALKIIEKYKIKSKLIFGIMPSASYEDNQWSLDNFVEVIKFLLKNYKGCQIVIFGGHGDVEKGKYIKTKVKSVAVINLCGITSLLETEFIIKKLNLLISNNTGLMHMAALEGIKVLAVFSPAELNGNWLPYGQNSKVFINRNVPGCDGYYYRKLPKFEKCVTAINVVDPKEICLEIFNLIGKKMPQ